MAKPFDRVGWHLRTRCVWTGSASRSARVELCQRSPGRLGHSRVRGDIRAWITSAYRSASGATRKPRRCSHHLDRASAPRCSVVSRKASAFVLDEERTAAIFSNLMVVL